MLIYRKRDEVVMFAETELNRNSAVMGFTGTLSEDSNDATFPYPTWTKPPDKHLVRSSAWLTSLQTFDFTQCLCR